MFRTLLLLIGLYFLVKYVRRKLTPGGNNKSYNNRFNPFSGQGNSGRKNFDQIEEAEYEDLSENEK